MVWLCDWESRPVSDVLAVAIKAIILETEFKKIDRYKIFDRIYYSTSIMSLVEIGCIFRDCYFRRAKEMIFT